MSNTVRFDPHCAEPAWRYGVHPHRRALRGELVADACVVGLGGSGLACVEELLAMGKRVVALDALTVGGGAAGRNGGFLLAGTAKFHHHARTVLGRERAVALYHATLAEIDRLAQSLPDVVRRTGSLRVACSSEEAADCDAMFDAMRDDALPVERYTGPEGEGLLFPSDGAFQPLHRCRVTASRARKSGAQLFEHSPVQSLAAGEVVTPHGRVRVDAIIVAVDGRLERLFPELAGRVRTARLQMIGTAPLAEHRFPRPVYARWGYDYWQQLPDRRLLLGGQRDAVEESEWTHDPAPSAPVQSRIERVLRDRLGVADRITHRWAASVAYTDDGLPFVGEVRPGIWATGAYSGTGNVLGALCGRATARAAFGERPELLDLLGAALARTTLAE